MIIDTELEKFLEKNVIEIRSYAEGDYISNIFSRAKQNGGFRVILNLSMLNFHVNYVHFKMESLETAPPAC